MRVQYDLAAPETAHFGIVPSLESQLEAVAGYVDLWAVRPDALALDPAGRVEAWLGRTTGRRLSQSTAAQRPFTDAQGLRFNGLDGSPAARLTLENPQLGAVPSVTLAIAGQIAEDQLGVDVQYLWGNQSPIYRLIYRTGNGGHLALQFGGSSTLNTLALPLPPGHQGRFAAVMVASPQTVALYAPGSPGASMQTPAGASPDWPAFHLGASSVPSLRGTIRKFGLWTAALSPSEVQSVVRWVGA